MKTQVLRVLSVFFLLFCNGFGQNVPVPTLHVPATNEVSFSYTLVANDFLDFGNGGDISSSHYFTRHLGVFSQAEAMEEMNNFKVHEYAVRVGPVYSFNLSGDFQPFVHAAAGVAGVSATYHPQRLHSLGGSFLAGGGADIRIRGALFARVASDVVYDWHASTGFGRGTVGFMYRFGDSGRR